MLRAKTFGFCPPLPVLSLPAASFLAFLVSWWCRKLHSVVVIREQERRRWRERGRDGKRGVRGEDEQREREVIKERGGVGLSQKESYG